MIEAHPYFETIRPDEVAECWDGVDADLYRALWACVNSYKAPRPEESEEPCYGMDSVEDFWDRFTDAEKVTLNALAAREDAKFNEPDDYDEHQPDEMQEWHDFDPDC